MADYCESILWQLIESGAMVAEQVQFADILATCAREGAAQHGRGAVVLAGPVAALKSWFKVIEAKLFSSKGGALSLNDLAEVGKVRFMPLAQLVETFGPHLAGGDDSAEALLRTYDPLSEFTFLRLYISTGAKGDASIFYDAVAYESEPDAAWKPQVVAKLQPPVTTLTLPQMLLSCMELHPDDAAHVTAGTFTAQQLPEFLKRQLCAGCKQPRTTNAGCAQCQVVLYCGRDCQVLHWRQGGHKAACKQLQAARESLAK